jgi:hypothetical protein
MGELIIVKILTVYAFPAALAEKPCLPGALKTWVCLYGEIVDEEEKQIFESLSRNA